MTVLHTTVDPRMVAALSVVRDYEASPAQEPDPIVAVTDPDKPGWLRVLYCISQDARPATREGEDGEG